MRRKTVKFLEEIIVSKDNEIKILTDKLNDSEKIKLDTIEDMLYMQDLRHDTQLRVLQNDYRQIVEIKIDEISRLKEDYDRICIEKNKLKEDYDRICIEKNKLKEDYDRICIEKNREIDSLKTETNELTIFRHEEVEQFKDYIEEIDSLKTEIRELTIFRNDEAELFKNYIEELVSKLNRFESTQIRNNTRIEIVLYHLRQFLLDRFHVIETQKIRCRYFQKLFQKYLKDNKIPYLGGNELHYIRILMKELGFKILTSDSLHYRGLMLK